MSRRKQARPIRHLDEEGAVADVASTDIIGKSRNVLNGLIFHFFL